MDMLRTRRTFTKRSGAILALKAALGGQKELDDARWMIAVNEEGRFAPVLIGMRYVPYAHAGITVVGG